MTTHSERIAVAIAMRSACVSKIMELAPSDRDDGYRSDRDPVRETANRLRQIDPADVLSSMGRLVKKLDDKEEFERCAREQYFPTTKRDDGTYIHPVTTRAWKLWQTAKLTKDGE